MAAEYRDKRTLITTVRGQYLSFATFPTTLLSHYPLPLIRVLTFQSDTDPDPASQNDADQCGMWMRFRIRNTDRNLAKWRVMKVKLCLLRVLETIRNIKIIGVNWCSVHAWKARGTKH